MAFTGQENQQIPLSQAKVLTAAFRHANPPGVKIGGYFSNNAIQSVITQVNCVGIRYYYGLDSSSNPVLVITGVDANQNDLYNGILIEMSLPCPSYCSTPNPLNSDN